MQSKQVVIIGSGVGGLAAACLLAKDGYRVTVLEKNEQLGGRAGRLRAKGFTFDTGPSWYLMVDAYERFFAQLGEKVADHFRLVKLAPHYRVFYKGLQQSIDITGNSHTDAATFEAIEAGSGKRLEQYITRSGSIYRDARDHLLYQNYNRVGDLQPEVLRAAVKLPLFSSLEKSARKAVNDPRLQKILEYPAMFLGAQPSKTPAPYSLLNHFGFTEGVFYPLGGMYEIVRALKAIGKKHGVTYHTEMPAKKIIVEQGRAIGVKTNREVFPADIVISNAGCPYTETNLLETPWRDHSARYWRRRTLAPSALLLYLGVNRRYSSLAHHNLLFSPDWQRNFQDIFSGADFPADPSLYVCAPSQTDPSVAPKGSENLFVLVPVAAGLTYTSQQLQEFIRGVLQTVEHELGLPGLRKHIVYQTSFCVQDFAGQFNAPGGTALGLAHTFRQSALLRPANRSKKLRDLYFVGADVHPGIGLPTALISAELVAQQIFAHDR